MDKQQFKITAIYMPSVVATTPSWGLASWTILVAERIITAYNLRYATIRAQHWYPFAASITVELMEEIT